MGVEDLAQVVEHRLDGAGIAQPWKAENLTANPFSSHSQPIKYNYWVGSAIVQGCFGEIIAFESIPGIMKEDSD